MNLDVIELQVRDFKNSLEWYKKIFKPLHIEKDFAMFKTGKATLAIYKEKNNVTTLYFSSKNLEKSQLLLKKKGVNVSSIIKTHWGRKFYFNDLENNKHFVYEEKNK